MFEEMNTIEVSGVKYPIKCDMAVLEQLQEIFGSIEKTEEGLLDWEPKLDENGEKIVKKVEENGEEKEMIETRFKWPRIKNINTAFYYMANEGAEIAGEKPPFKSVKEAARAIDKTPIEMARILHQEFIKCFERKNRLTTQEMK